MPDVASVPDQPTSTGLVYQPSWSGARAGATAEATGGVWSMRMTGVVAEAVLPSSPLTVQVRVVPVVSPGMGTAGSQPLVEEGSPLTDQWTVTGLTYQPLLPSVPEMVCVMDGDVARAIAGTPATIEQTAKTATRPRISPMTPRPPCLATTLRRRPGAVNAGAI